MNQWNDCCYHKLLLKTIFPQRGKDAKKGFAVVSHIQVLNAPLQVGRLVSIKRMRQNFKKVFSLDPAHKGKEHVFFHHGASAPPTCEWGIPHSPPPVWEARTLSHHEGQRAGQRLPPSRPAGCWHRISLSQSDSPAHVAKGGHSEACIPPAAAGAACWRGRQRGQQRRQAASRDTPPAVWPWPWLCLFRFRPFLLIPRTSCPAVPSPRSASPRLTRY